MYHHVYVVYTVETSLVMFHSLFLIVKKNFFFFLVGWNCIELYSAKSIMQKRTLFSFFFGFVPHQSYRTVVWKTFFFLSTYKKIFQKKLKKKSVTDGTKQLKKVKEKLRRNVSHTNTAGVWCWRRTEVL